jgi:hypothetical protein
MVRLLQTVKRWPENHERKTKGFLLSFLNFIFGEVIAVLYNLMLTFFTSFYRA